MATSAARVAANRRNAQLSTGPRTPEGKAICRGNALKHGMTGEGVVVPDEDVAEVSRRFGALEAEMAPKREMGLILVRRIALCSVRLDRSAREEAARVGEAMRNAAGAYEDRRLAEVEALFDWIAAEPATNARRLRQSPEGVDRMLRAWLELDADLAGFNSSRWSYSQWQRMENLKGRRPEDFPLSRDGALCKTIWGEPGHLAPGESDGTDPVPRRDYAVARLRERVAEAVAELKALASTFDLEALARERAEAVQRALFDSSKEAILARKYEAANERAMYKALNELREVEAGAEPTPQPDATSEPDEDCEALALNGTGPPGGPGPGAPRPRLASKASSGRGRRRENPSVAGRSGHRPSA